MEHIELEYPFGVFYVEIVRKKIKNVHLKVYRELKVAISVPIYAEKSWIESFVQDKKEWIGKQLEKYIKSSGYNNLLDLKSGSSTQFLGKDLRVYLVQSDKNKVEADEKSVTVYLKDGNDREKENALFSEWWKKQAEEIYASIVDRYMSIFLRHKIQRPQICIRKMKTLWGSCSKHLNKITLNEYLLKADIRCIEYVVFHELTHLIYNAHNQDFYDFLTIYMPDWKERKKRLDTEVVQGL
jgi:predicted metal-dependent hydrolase